MNKTKIFIVDDHPIFRKGLAHLINDEDDMTVSGEAEDVFGAIQEIKKNLSDMVIADITLKDTSGLELIKYITDHFPKIPVLVLSMHDETVYAERALKAGARGYIMKQEMTENVAEAIRHVLSGRIYLSERMNEKLLNVLFGKTRNSEPSDVSNPCSMLSDRELEIFSLVGKGFKRKQIAEKLNLNVNTVGTYRERIKEKLNFQTSAEMTAMAIRWIQDMENCDSSV
jgi:DNA-binding NarL/FixJ family response regulator